MAGKNVYLTMDIGGTKTRIALIDNDGNILDATIFSTPGTGRPQEVLALIKNKVQEMLKFNSSLCLQGAGAALAGFISERKQVISCPNLEGWTNYAFKKEAEKIFSLPVMIENDANAAAVGENMFGAGRGTKDMVYITISTGIGAGIISGGSLIRGCSGLAGEAGHLKLDETGVNCGCGCSGCLETIASGTAFKNQGSEFGAADAAEVFAAAEKGAEWAERILNNSLKTLGIHIANIVSLLNPCLIVVGGGMSAQGDKILIPLRQWVLAMAAPGAAEDVAVIPALLGEKAALLGMAALLEEGRH